MTGEHQRAVLRALLAANRGIHAEATRDGLEDMAEANPDLHRRVQAVRDANPGLQSPPLREPEPTPPPPDPAVAEMQVTEESA